MNMNTNIIIIITIIINFITTRIDIITIVINFIITRINIISILPLLLSVVLLNIIILQQH